jgi:hypothetical protein
MKYYNLHVPRHLLLVPAGNIMISRHYLQLNACRCGGEVDRLSLALIIIQHIAVEFIDDS